MVHDLRNLQTNYTPVLVTNIPFLVLYVKNKVAAKIVRVYMPMLWVIPRGLLEGKLKLNPREKPITEEVAFLEFLNDHFITKLNFIPR